MYLKIKNNYVKKLKIKLYNTQFVIKYLIIMYNEF